MPAALGELLQAATAAHPDRVALRLEDAQMTYAELADRVHRFAARLVADGVGPGDRVGLMLPNVPAFVVGYFGILHAGAVVVACNPLHKPREVEHQMADTGAPVIVSARACAEAAQAGADAAGTTCLVTDTLDLGDLCADAPVPAVPRTGGDPAVILYTNAIDGRPMGAVLTHASLLHNAITVRERFGFSTDTVQLGALPLFHGFGQTAVQNATIAGGGCVTLVPRFDPEHVAHVLERDGVTMMNGVPTMYAALAAMAPGPVESLKLCISGGAHLPPEIREAFEARLGVALREGYGLTETSPVVTFNHPGQPQRAGTVGTAIDDVQLRLDPVTGELSVKGPNVMREYYNQPEATAAVLDDEGWLATGDVGTIDDDGYLTLTGRTKNLIIRAGYNVYPAEVEQILREHPAIAGCTVVGVPQLELGEEVGAAVVLADGAELTPREIRAWVRSQLAAYKSPTHIWIVDSLADWNAPGR